MDTFSYFGMKPNKIIFPDGSSFRYRVAPTRVFLEAGEPEIEPDPVLANNTWEVIKAVCQSGQAANWWALGDAKNIAVSDVGDVPHAIVDMTEGRYEYSDGSERRSNVVFQAVPTIGSYVFNSSSNTNANGAYACWYISELRTSMNSGTIYGLYDSSFTALLEEVQTYEALDGTENGNVVQYQSDKLFLPTLQEIFNAPSASYVQSAESELGIVEFGYYALNNDANANRIKYPFGSDSTITWWLRTPRASNTGGYGCYVSRDGSMNYGGGGQLHGVAPCFAF